MPVNRFSWLLSHLHLNDNSAVYNPNRIVATYESMIKFKGCHSSKQYMPKKPIKRGYKVWALADNYPLMSYLKSNGIYACGTVNMTRKHLPQLKDNKSLKQGEYDWNTDQFSISIIKWKDKRSVSLLSNFHDPTDTDIVPTRAKDGTLTMIPCPKVLKDYNENMNCVDKLNQNKKSCQIDRKSQKWWHRIFFHFIDIAVEKSAHQSKISTRRRCAKCSTREKEVRTEWMCAVCNVPLCITKNRNCFADHHK
ncbi:unnamed protein product [Macrosiphum euphorbiae]|uniref:PiggyBac transposable element-derived protein domain-containing protein n=1 Tax=Macrosiphum euphorbiae TaxID=13131 RepID=A0AAV0WN85_9HEMI|nr:unnamed protein product [Macrosiphum euphorbiae]